MKKTLLVLFEEKQPSFVIEEGETNEITIKGKKYQNRDNISTLGFYDWLRTELGKVVGVRLYPFPDSYFPFSMFKNYSYVKVTENLKIEVFFSRILISHLKNLVIKVFQVARYYKVLIASC